MISASPRIRTVSARSNHELVEARQVSDVIRFRPAIAGSTIGPVDHANQLRIELEPSVLVTLMLLAVQINRFTTHGCPLRERSLNVMQNNLRDRDSYARRRCAVRYLQHIIDRGICCWSAGSFDICLEESLLIGRQKA